VTLAEAKFFFRRRYTDREIGVMGAATLSLPAPEFRRHDDSYERVDLVVSSTVTVT
jgi:hypothetical protein